MNKVRNLVLAAGISLGGTMTSPEVAHAEVAPQPPAITIIENMGSLTVEFYEEVPAAELPETGADTWLLLMGAGAAIAGAIGARRMLRKPPKE